MVVVVRVVVVVVVVVMVVVVRMMIIVVVVRDTCIVETHVHLPVFLDLILEVLGGRLSIGGNTVKCIIISFDNVTH